MSKHTKHTSRYWNSPRRLACLLAGLGLLTALPAGATLVQNTLTAHASSTAGSGPGAATNSDGPNTSSTASSAFAPASSGLSSASASAFGLAGGPYGAGGDGMGVFDSQGHFIRRWTIKNDEAVAASYSFNFFIYYGSLAAGDQGNGGSGSAEYQATITRDGSWTLWSSSAVLNSDGSKVEGGSLLSGATLSGASGNWYYSWGGTNVSIDLGILNPGEETRVVYDLVGRARGNYGFGSCGNGELETFAVVIGDGECAGTSRAFLGDPDSLNSTPLPNGGNFSLIRNSVPEPSSLALLVGIGLAAFGNRRRQARA